MKNIALILFGHDLNEVLFATSDREFLVSN